MLSEVNKILLIFESPIESVSSILETLRRGNQALELKKRIDLSQAVFGTLRNQIKSEFPLCLKRKIFNPYILPLITYGVETLIWIGILRKSDEKLRVTQKSMNKNLSSSNKNLSRFLFQIAKSSIIFYSLQQKSPMLLSELLNWRGSLQQDWQATGRYYAHEAKLEAGADHL